MRTSLALDLALSSVPSQHDSTSLLLLLQCFLREKLESVSRESFFCFCFFQNRIFSRESVSGVVFVFYNLCIRSVMDLTRKQSSCGIFKMCSETPTLPPSLPQSNWCYDGVHLGTVWKWLHVSEDASVKLSIQHSVGDEFRGMFNVLSVVVIIIIMIIFILVKWGRHEQTWRGCAVNTCEW